MSLVISWHGPKLTNCSNAREHWGKRSARADKQRGGACQRVANAKLRGEVPDGPPWTVIITRIGPRKLDSDDNVNISAKHIRDGIADALGIDDGDERVKWIYAQERGPYGVRIRVEGHGE